MQISTLTRVRKWEKPKQHFENHISSNGFKAPKTSKLRRNDHWDKLKAVVRFKGTDKILLSKLGMEAFACCWLHHIEYFPLNLRNLRKRGFHHYIRPKFLFLPWQVVHDKRKMIKFISKKKKKNQLCDYFGVEVSVPFGQIKVKVSPKRKAGEINWFFWILTAVVMKNEARSLS